jgi:hypothetical protein
MSTRTTSKRRKKEDPLPGVGPLSKEEMLNWGRRIQIKRMIEGAPSLFDYEERAWKELSAYRSMPRILIDVCEVGLLYDSEEQSRQLITTTFPLTALGFNPQKGMKFMVLGANITPEKKTCKSTSPASSKTRKRSKKRTKPSSKKAGRSPTTGRSRTRMG